MASSPLFVADVDTLKAKLRLSPDATGDAGDAIIDEAVLSVRTDLLRRLTLSRVQTLQGYTFTEDPLTDEEVLRATSNTCELNWIRLRLLSTMPTFFLDASGGAPKAWNTEALTRESESDLEREKTRLQILVEEALDLMSAEESLGSEADIEVFDGTPDEDYQTPDIGSTLERRLDTRRFID